MRKLILASFLICTLALVTTIPVQAKKPLRGTMDLEFNLSWAAAGGINQILVPEWIGTITIGNEEYGMEFYAIGSGKPFTEDPPGSVHFFEEIWVIYTEIEFIIPSEDPTDFVRGEVLLWGYDVGITNLKNSKYHMNGNVEEAFDREGYPDFSMWTGRSVHMSGVILWQEVEVPAPEGPVVVVAPQYAPGTFRIN